LRRAGSSPSCATSAGAKYLPGKDAVLRGMAQFKPQVAEAGAAKRNAIEVKACAVRPVSLRE